MSWPSHARKRFRGTVFASPCNDVLVVNEPLVALFVERIHHVSSTADRPMVVALDGRRRTTPTTCTPAAVVILEGAYSARPELADLLDLRVLLDAPLATRMRRLSQREGDSYRDDWFARWDEAEQHYFGTVMRADAFDLVLNEK